VRHGVDLQRQDIAGAAHAHGIVELLHLNASAAQLGSDGFQMLGGDVLHQNVAAGGRSGHHVAAGLDLIRDDAVGAAVHLFHAAHLDDIGACAADIRTAHIQEVGQIHHMGLLGAVFQNGLALGIHRREHAVHGGTHADLIKEDVCAVQLPGTHGDHTVVHAVLCAQRAEHLQMLVDGTRAEVAAAGHGHLCLAETGQQRTQKIVAGAHLTGQIVRNVGTGQMGGIDLVGVAVDHLDLCTQNTQDLQAHRHIADIRQIFDHADIRCHNGCRQDAHSRILRAGDDDFAVQGLTARNNKLFQFYDLLVGGLHPAGLLRFCKSLLTICCFRARQTMPQDTAILLYTIFTKKQSLIWAGSIIFCFAHFRADYSENLISFSEFLQKNVL